MRLWYTIKTPFSWHEYDFFRSHNIEVSGIEVIGKIDDLFLVSTIFADEEDILSMMLKSDRITLLKNPRIPSFCNKVIILFYRILK